ncbi:MAG: aldehyde ferredoxin oxidoreductase family protein [Chloroflexota bacterium]|nr:aldehyde ferredoxin oxidoreductase family protein [Chloroflexota bacterium]
MSRYGYFDRILRVNLSTGELSCESMGDEWWRMHLGGRALIAHFLLKEVPADADPFGPENVLAFANGVFTGATLSGSGRNSAGAKSPLTGGYGDGEAGGFWGAELKRAGWDGIVVTGQASEPVYLWIEDGQVDIRPARHLWGREVDEVEDAIKDELGERRVRIAQCGIAGEHLVRYAVVVHDLSRMVGRGGIGAVMGSKRLKAIAVKGTGKVPVANAARLREITGWLRENDEKLLANFRKNGTAGGVPYNSATSNLPTFNFRQGHFEQADAISGQAMTEQYLTGAGTCFACLVTCKRETAVTAEQAAKAGYGDAFIVSDRFGGPEYESIAALGSCNGIGDLVPLLKANELCNRWGLDTISAGVTIATAIEAFELGLLSQEDTGGIVLRWGDGRLLIRLLEMIARREGFGDRLAEGSARLAQGIGPAAAALVVAVKGQELPMHEPRIKHALGLGYAISPTGADHMHNLHDTMYTRDNRRVKEVVALGWIDGPMDPRSLDESKVRLLRNHSNWCHMTNSAEICNFLPYSYEQTVDILAAVTGWDLSVDELVTAGERALNLARVFNAGCGFGRGDDWLPARSFEAFEDGPRAGWAVPEEDLREARNIYYALAGWDPVTAAPTEETLDRLGIGWAGTLT